LYFDQTYLLASYVLSPISMWQAHSGDIAWVLMSTTLVLMMTIPGLAFFYGGLAQQVSSVWVLCMCIYISPTRASKSRQRNIRSYRTATNRKRRECDRIRMNFGFLSVPKNINVYNPSNYTLDAFDCGTTFVSTKYNANQFLSCLLQDLR